MTDTGTKPATDRRIYHWKDDRGQDCRSDPMTLSRRFHQALKEFDVDYARVRADLAVGAAINDLLMASEKDKMETILHGLESNGQLAKVAYHVFEVPPISRHEEGGWTEAEAIDALMSFFKWEDELAGESGSSQSTPKPSDSAGCPSSSTIATGTAST